MKFLQCVHDQSGKYHRPRFLIINIIIIIIIYRLKTPFLTQEVNQRTDSPESRLEGNGLEVFTLFCSNLLKAFKIQNNLTIRQYYMQAYF